MSGLDAYGTGNPWADELDLKVPGSLVETLKLWEDTDKYLKKGADLYE